MRKLALVVTLMLSLVAVCTAWGKTAYLGAEELKSRLSVVSGKYWIYGATESTTRSTTGRSPVGNRRRRHLSAGFLPLPIDRPVAGRNSRRCGSR